MIQKIVMPSVGSFCGPSPIASSPMPARMAAATAVTNEETRNGRRLGAISRKMMRIGPAPESFAMST